MNVKKLRLSAIYDPAFVTAVQAAAAEADSGPDLERLLRSRGWPVEVLDLSGAEAVGEPAVEVRRLDTPVSSRT